jgi:hypothetical protein
MCSWHHPVLKIKKLPNFLNFAFFKKKNGQSLMKKTVFAGHGFSPKRVNKPHLKFYMKKGVLAIYRMMSRIYGFSG